MAAAAAAAAAVGVCKGLINVLQEPTNHTIKIVVVIIAVVGRFQSLSLISFVFLFSFLLGARKLNPKKWSEKPRNQ